MIDSGISATLGDHVVGGAPRKQKNSFLKPLNVLSLKKKDIHTIDSLENTEFFSSNMWKNTVIYSHVFMDAVSEQGAGLLYDVLCWCRCEQVL